MMARSFFLVVMLAMLVCGRGEVPGSTYANDPADESVMLARPEVRLRKLHLVRPDLIPYPIAHEVVC